MPERFESASYSPERTKIMKCAFDDAWRQTELIEQDFELTRKLLASAIIDQVDAGLQDSGRIVAGALATLAVARNLTQPLARLLA